MDWGFQLSWVHSQTGVAKVIFPAVASLLIVFGCGILSAIFGLPERYIERDVTAEEMVGTWNVTPDSEADVNDFVPQDFTKAKQ